MSGFLQTFCMCRSLWLTFETKIVYSYTMSINTWTYMAQPEKTPSDLIIKQNHEMVVMKPLGNSKVTLIGRRLYSTLLATTQKQVVGKTPLATDTFKAPLSSLLKVSSDSTSAITVAKSYFKEMLDLKVSWESTAPGDGVKWIGLNMLSQAKITETGGQLWVSWAFPPEIMEMIINPERYAVWNLKISSRLSTYCALALYEICARYRDNPTGVTSRKSPDWWIDALSNTAAGADKKRREWRKFKGEKIKAAILEINSETDLEIELIEHKEGRALGEVQFAVRKKQRQIDLNFESKIIDVEIVQEAMSLGVPENKVRKLLNTYTDELISAKLKELRDRMLNKSLVQIEHPYAYLKSILNNVNLSDQQSKSESKKHQSENSGSSTKLNSSSAVDLFNLDSTANQQHTDLFKEFNELDEETRQYWIDRTIQSLKETSQFQAIYLKRAHEKHIYPGLFGSQVARVYAENTYGPEWQKESSLQALN